MEYLEQNPILKFNPNTLLEIRKPYGYEKIEDLNKAIDILEAWIESQEHFVKKKFNRKYLDTTLLTSKGSIEKSKQRIEKYCSGRTKLPKFFNKFDMLNEFEEFNKICCVLTLPKPTTEYVRVILAKAFKGKITPELVLDLYRSTIILAEYLKTHDYTKGYILIFDLREMDLLEALPNINFMDMKHMMTFFLTAFGMILKGFYVISTSQSVEILAGIIKQCLSAKLADRFHVLRTIDTLNTIFPDILPVEYGGNEISIYKLREQWLNILGNEDHVEFMKSMAEAKTDESLRSNEVPNDYDLGISGTFRSLNVD